MLMRVLKIVLLSERVKSMEVCRELEAVFDLLNVHEVGSFVF
jgi:hypothetical protein